MSKRIQEPSPTSSCVEAVAAISQDYVTIEVSGQILRR
ncbi:hypothetical protein [Sporisorium scitamineum]|uniref:Uncharacterized protein n=1 Tax=Sporisorium scitamineum TaxID=49012 RepID=A0A0F7SAC8_9BASI|nr:hypothetical protein [Sporisorium scitamineum]